MGTSTKTGALAGVRVVDLSWVRAGPQTTRIMAMMGAEVIRVEWPEPPDVIRVSAVAPSTPEGVEPGLNTSGDFNNFACNKLSCTLNVRHPRAFALLKQLISISDVVVENFSSRVLERWGLSYAEQRRFNPAIIYISMAGFGHSGPLRDYDTWGPTVQAVSGLTFISGAPGRPPSGWGHSYMDHTGGYYGAMAALMALHYRHRTGVGQYIDLSQVEAGCTLTGAAILDFTANGRSCRRPGFPPGNRTAWPGQPVTNSYSRGGHAAPHNSYRCSGNDHCDWCVIACRTDDEWRALVTVMGNPAWARNPRFETLLGRLDSQEEMDRGITAWTRTLPKTAVVEALQAAGVPCAPVNSMSDRVERDPQLLHRGAFAARTSHPILGDHRFESIPARFSSTPWEIWRHGPLIGQDNMYVCQELCGLSAQEFDEMEGTGAFWPERMQR